MDASQIPNFQQFCEQQFQLRQRLGQMEDARPAPQSSAGIVAEAICFMGALGLGSLFPCDQELRTEVGHQWFGQQTPVVSDTTMSRSDMEPIPKQGKELPASHALLRRVTTALGPRSLDLVLGDGLSFNAPLFPRCLDELHCAVLVKTDDARREVIVDAMGLFRPSPGQFQGIGRAEGVDSERLCTYQMAMASGFEMEGVEQDISVVWIHEEYLKKPRIGDFWLIFTQRDGPGLTIEEARNFGHLCWEVENHGFKAFNATRHSQHRYSQKPPRRWPPSNSC